jgi:hypothetical protein
MRRFLVVTLLASSLSFAVPRDVPRDGGGGWFHYIRAVIHHVLHSIGSTDYIVPPKP